MDKYNLDTGKKYIKDIFAPDCFYNIPEYQRPFVWGKDQIDILLEDLTSAFEQDGKKEYFIGCMIWNTKKVKSNGIDYVSQDILDGQQRFITLYILHGVIRDLSEDQKLKEKVTVRMRQEEDLYDGIPERNRVFFEIRDDKEFLDKYVIEDGGTCKVEEIDDIVSRKETSKSVRNIGSAILIMKDWWKSFSQSMEEDRFQFYLGKFFQYLSSKVLTLYLATPDNLDDAYNLFTVLNSRGLQLQVSDILRAQNLRVISDDNLRKTYAEKWSSFEDNIGEPFRGFDDFLWTLIFIKMKYRSDENQSLQKAFSFLFQKGILEKGISTFDFVEKYVNHYDSIVNGSIKTNETGLLFQNLNFILTSTFGSVYMAPLLHYRECFGDYRITDFLIKLDNLLSIPWLTGKRTSQTRIFILLRRMEEFRGQVSDSLSIKNAADEFINSEYLRYDYDDEKAATKLDVEELFEMLDTENWGAYAGTRINKTRYLLLKLDLLLGNLNTMLQFNRLNSSVEHIMPQKISQTNWNIEDIQHQEWLHKLGNIVLIDRRKNISLSNRLYKDKKARYQGAIETRANTNFIFMYFSEWNIETIKANHDRINKIFRDYYMGNSLETILKIKKQMHESQLGKINFPNY